MSPENLMPPSAISGMLASREAFAHARIAVIWGMPAPLTTRVVQIDPGPMPTLIASAPAAIRSRAASSVAMFPTMRFSSGNLRFTAFTASSTREECPCAVSIAITSTFMRTSSGCAFEKISARSDRGAGAQPALRILCRQRDT